MSRDTWNEERVALLKSFVETGLSCAQIAQRIGVTRNAVIGKVSRLGLSTALSAPARTGVARVQRERSTHAAKFPQRRIAAALRALPIPVADIIVDAHHRCSLIELEAGNCRWPIGDPGAEDFCFCGGPQLAGFAYCPPHARLAYQGGSRAPRHASPPLAPAAIPDMPRKVA